MNLAPIVLFVYNRPDHTRRTLMALSKNELAQHSKLFVFADGPKNDVSSKDLDNVKSTRSVLMEQNWCKEITIKYEDKNKGLANSIIDGVTKVINKFGKVIVLEDDIVTGKYFLRFMNESLELYANDTKVFGVSGYKFPTLEKIKPVTYFLPISSSWSFGTWLDRWNEVNFDGKFLLADIKKRQLMKKINFGNYPYYEMLENQVKGNNDSWAIRFHTSMFLKNKLFLFPNLSLIQNIGFDNSGQHCEIEDFFSKISVSDELINVQSEPIIVREDVKNIFKKSFRSQMFEAKSISNKSKLFLIKNRLINQFKRIIK